MLHEICADFTVMKALPQAAESEVGVGKYGSISFLNDELIEESKAARKRVAVSFITIVIDTRSDMQCSGDAFQINAGCVTGRV